MDYFIDGSATVKEKTWDYAALALEGFSWGAFDAEFLPEENFESAFQASLASSKIQAMSGLLALAGDVYDLFNPNVRDKAGAERQLQEGIKDDMSNYISILLTALPKAYSEKFLAMIPGLEDMGPEAKKEISIDVVKLGAKWARHLAPGAVDGILDNLAERITKVIAFVAGL